MAERPFERARFEAALRTRRLGRTLLVYASTGSTNDDAWAALLAGGADGVAVVADAQTQGRGRAGRTWAHAPGLGLALSVALRWRTSAGAGALPLVAGLALAEALGALGAVVRLKWPNDVLARGAKLAGVLCESRRLDADGEAVVIGAGVNVRQRAEDFPPELRAHATSLALAGADAAVEDVAAAFLNALEPRLDALARGGRAELLAAWSARAAFWGESVTVHAPGGDVTGVAQRLDADGALVLRLESGAEWTALAGDVEAHAGGEAR